LVRATRNTRTISAAPSADFGSPSASPANTIAAAPAASVSSDLP
jgi:hypothetical protein